MNIGVQLRVYRKSRGHSVQKVSELTGINVDKLYKWEKGTRPSDAEDLLKIREYMSGKVETPPKKENGKLETEQNGTTTLTGHMTIQDHIAIIEARRLEAVARAEEIKAMYNAVQQEKGVLYDIIKENLTQLMANSNKHLAYLEKILLVDRADHETTMDSLDRIEHQPVGSNAKRAGIRELDASKNLRKKGRKNLGGVNK